MLLAHGIFQTAFEISCFHGSWHYFFFLKRQHFVDRFQQSLAEMLYRCRVMSWNLPVELCKNFCAIFQVLCTVVACVDVAGLISIHKRHWNVIHDQCRINNGNKCSNCYGSRASWGPAVLCVKFVLYYVQGWTLEFRCPWQTQKEGPIFYTCYSRNFIRWNQV